MKKSRLMASSLLLCFLAFCINQICANQGFIVVPIADLLGQSMQSIIKLQKNGTADAATIIEKYENLPISTTTNPLNCPRIYQLLFNQPITLIKTEGPEALIEVPYAFYAQSDTKKLYNRYWTLRKNIMLLSEVKLLTDKQFFIPAAPWEKDYSLRKSITLIKPFYDRITKKMYSAGTRFSLISSLRKNYKVALYSPIHKNIVTTIIPHSHCFLYSQNKIEAQKMFVNLLRSWAKISENSFSIPYVWGGASFSYNAQIQSGFDCSGAIICAAQTSGIPLLLKNSSALMSYLEELDSNSSLQEGDIIWFPGHVLIVSDLKKQTIIEARGYKSGYGKLHELPLKYYFQGVHNFQHLLDLYYKKQPLQLLNAKYEPMLTITTFKILRISSAWSFYENHTQSKELYKEI